MFYIEFQASIQTLSSLCAKRQRLSPGADFALYGKRFIASNDNGSPTRENSSVNRRENPNPDSDAKRLKSEPKTTSGLPEEPTDCCMSGCANCVWIQYAEELKNKFCSSDKELREIIMNKISDPNMKMFLSMELDHLSDEGKWRPSNDDKEKKN
ncbi:Oxidoreductase-like domain-containing protein 1 [Frankliniella fusca]|uniref:Oxidoreductase-like domain-containing protein 1 n=1 Tax=Frankliniella fusca TaxID=407009 RepID=A0AAE1L7K8_9NEOP|nr:Oxidoreductase-like domain-containing protein 1 [Frankliniella fusca]